MNLSELTLFELYKLYYMIGFEVLRRIWFVPVILILVFLALMLNGNLPKFYISKK